VSTHPRIITNKRGVAHVLLANIHRTYKRGMTRISLVCHAPFISDHSRASKFLLASTCDIALEWYRRLHQLPSFKCLSNIVCLNSVTKKYMACGRALLNHQDCSIGNALSVLTHNVKIYEPTNDITKEILLDFDEAESNAFQDNFGSKVMRVIRLQRLLIARPC